MYKNGDLPIYIPKPKVCHMEQYHCCKHRQHCRLYPLCSQIQPQTVCKRDCPTCAYDGCSLTPQRRQSEPVYIAGVIQADRIDLDLEGRYWRGHEEHRKQHKKLWYFYNTLWGDYKEKHIASCRKYRQANIEICREKARIRAKIKWRETHPNCGKGRRKYYPECGLDCANCPHPDCILPENWSDQLIAAAKHERDPGYHARYYRANKQKINARSKEYYADNRDRMRRQQKEYYQKPEVKAQFARRSKQYVEAHREQVQAYKKAWYEKNKERINAGRRKKHDVGRSNESPAYREV